MVIEWNIVATILAPLIALFIGAILNRAAEKRPRLVTYLGHVSTHRIERNDGVPFNVFTHSIVLKNAGRSPARNVRLTHSVLPNYNILPSVKFETEILPNGEIDIVIPVLVPRQELTISYLYYPPNTWDKLYPTIRSDEGFARELKVLPTIQFPKWVNIILVGLMFIGVVAVLYVLIQLSGYAVDGMVFGGTPLSE